MDQLGLQWTPKGLKVDQQIYQKGHLGVFEPVITVFGGIRAPPLPFMETKPQNSI